MSDEQREQRWTQAVDLNGEALPACDSCDAAARWSICNLEGDQMEPIVRWFACGRHIHSVLAGGDWELDSVHLYDMSGQRS